MRIFRTLTITLGAIGALFANSAQAAFDIYDANNQVVGSMATVSPPVEGNSWNIDWSANAFIFPFTRITATINSGGPDAFEAPGLTVLTGGTGWSSTFGASQSAINGSARNQIDFRTHFTGDITTSTVSLFFQYFTTVGGNEILVATTPTLYWDGQEFDYTPVPEPTTVIAGALLLLPFAASTIRFVRKTRSAQES